MVEGRQAGFSAALFLEPAGHVWRERVQLIARVGHLLKINMLVMVGLECVRLVSGRTPAIGLAAHRGHAIFGAPPGCFFWRRAAGPPGLRRSVGHATARDHRASSAQPVKPVAGCAQNTWVSAPDGINRRDSRRWHRQTGCGGARSAQLAEQHVSHRANHRPVGWPAWSQRAVGEQVELAFLAAAGAIEIFVEAAGVDLFPAQATTKRGLARRAGARPCPQPAAGSRRSLSGRRNP